MVSGDVVAGVVTVLFFLATLPLSVSAEQPMTFGSDVYSGDSAFAYNPNQDDPSSNPPSSNSPAVPPPSPAPTTPASSSGSCPEDFTKTFENTFKIYTDTDHVIVGADGDSAQMRLDQRTAAVFGSKAEYFTESASQILSKENEAFCLLAAASEYRHIVEGGGLWYAHARCKFGSMG